MKLEVKIFPCSHKKEWIFWDSTGIFGYHVPHMGEKEMRKRFLLASLKEKDHLENLGVDGR
jgi:hypothetical protein